MFQTTNQIGYIPKWKWCTSLVSPFSRFFIRVGRKTGVGLGAPPGKHGDVLQVLPSILTAWWFKSTSFILRCFNPSFTQHCWKEPINMRLWQHKHIRFDVFIPLVDRLRRFRRPFFSFKDGLSAAKICSIHEKSWYCGWKKSRTSYPLAMTNSVLLKMAIDIVSCPINNGDFPYLCKRLPEGNNRWFIPWFIGFLPSVVQDFPSVIHDFYDLDE